MIDQEDNIIQSKDIKDHKDAKEERDRDNDQNKRHNHKDKKKHDKKSTHKSHHRSRNHDREREREHNRDRDRKDKRKDESRSRSRRDRSERSERSDRRDRRERREHRDNREGRDDGEEMKMADNSKFQEKQKEYRDNKYIDNNINRQGRFKFDSPPKEYVSLATQEHAKQIIENTGQIKQLLNSVKDVPTSEIVQQFQLLQTFHQASKSNDDKKLYIGNLPTNQTPLTLCQFINSALKKMSINQQTPGDSCISAWISPDGTYAFCEFRSSEEANSAFQLNNVVILGKQLKVGRPRTYTSSQQMNNISPSMMFPGMGNVMNYFNSLLTNPMANVNVNPLKELTKDNQTLLEIDQQVKVQIATQVLCMKNMVNLHELDIDEEYNEILEDIKEQCQNYGQVLSLIIPRPIENQVVQGLGKVFVMFANIDQAKECKKYIQGMTFGGKSVEVSFYNQEKYLQAQLGE